MRWPILYGLKAADFLAGLRRYAYIKNDGDFGQPNDSESIAYKLKFSSSNERYGIPSFDDKYGIPICTTPEGADYAYCKTSENGDPDYATENHKVKINFLGEQWVISEINPPSNNLNVSGKGDTPTKDDALVNGGSVKLSKEAVLGVLGRGDSLPMNDFRFRFDNISCHEKCYGVFSVLDTNGNVLLDEVIVGEGQTKELNINGKPYLLHVYSMSIGWVDIAIFSKELKLQDGQKLDLNGDNNSDCRASLWWKNANGYIDISEVEYHSQGNPEQVDSLREIILYCNNTDTLSSVWAEDIQVTKVIRHLNEGEEIAVNSATIKLLRIPHTNVEKRSKVTPCCTVNMDFVSALLMSDYALSVPVITLYNEGFGELIILDKDVAESEVIISVGGEKVNKVTASLLQNDLPDWSRETKIVEEVVSGSKIVVAGREAEDTIDAAREFITLLKRV